MPLQICEAQSGCDDDLLPDSWVGIELEKVEKFLYKVLHYCIFFTITNSLCSWAFLGIMTFHKNVNLTTYT